MVHGGQGAQLCLHELPSATKAESMNCLAFLACQHVWAEWASAARESLRQKDADAGSKKSGRYTEMLKTRAMEGALTVPTRCQTLLFFIPYLILY